MKREHLLIIGAGSAGKRHLKNFADLGCSVSAFDPRADRVREAERAAPLVNGFTHLEDAFAGAVDYTGVVICSPPAFHVEQALAALGRSLPVFLEKPMSTDAESGSLLVAEADRTRTPLLLGYTYRWWPPIREMKSRLDHGVVGKVLRVQCVMSAHLADWHPWESYQEFFMSSRDLGGGALLDESHVLDLMLFFFGMPGSAFAKVERLSSLEIQTDDNVDALLLYDGGLRVSVHLDLYSRPHERTITVYGELGTLQWSYEDNCLRFADSAERSWSETRYTCERNGMFVDAAHEFLRVLETGQQPSCGVRDGYAVLQLVEAMRRSSEGGRVEAIG